MIVWYGELERRLLEFLHFVPLSSENWDTHLPLLAPVIVEAGSLVDTVFREEYADPSKAKSDLRIGDFAPHFEPRLNLSELRSLIYQHPPALISPFEGWTSEKSGEFAGLDWWTSYNRIKHNRIEKYNLATLGTAVAILCALHQVISSLPTFTRALWRHDILIPRHGYLHLTDQNIEDTEAREFALIETELFATLVGRKRFPAEVKDITPGQYNLGLEGRRLARFLGRY